MKNKLTLLFKKPAIIILLISAFPLQGILAQTKPNFIIGIGVSQYRDKVEQNYLELYYTYKQSVLTYKSKGDAFEGAIIMTITLSSNESDSVLLNKKFRIPGLVADTAITDQQRSLVGMLKMFVPNLNQNMSIQSVDENDESRTHTFTLELPSKSFFSDSVSISDIELASTIRKTQNGKKNLFTKGPYDVIPNPSGIYSSNLPVIYYYYEVYNLLQGIAGEKYRVNNTILDLNGLQVQSNQKTKPRVNESSVEVGQINISSLQSGIYVLDAQIYDENGTPLSNSMKPFRYINLNPASATPVSDLSSSDLLSSQLYGKTEDALNEEFASLLYISSRSEKRAYKKTKDLDSKVKFLTDFWEKRDSNPSTPQNEYRDQYLSRAEYSSRFATGLKKGWQSDRGRITIKYGIPDEYDRQAAAMGEAPHEIWYYNNIQGGVLFVFAALGGGQEYRIIHSTHRSELQDYQWRETLKK
ncbi:MAG: GWxTD domain-containing protein [Candidatus Neomarinimicrobiota bacterium]